MLRTVSNYMSATTTAFQESICSSDSIEDIHMASPAYSPKTKNLPSYELAHSLLLETRLVSTMKSPSHNFVDSDTENCEMASPCMLQKNNGRVKRQPNLLPRYPSNSKSFSNWSLNSEFKSKPFETQTANETSPCKPRAPRNPLMSMPSSDLFSKKMSKETTNLRRAQSQCYSQDAFLKTMASPDTPMNLNFDCSSGPKSSLIPSVDNGKDSIRRVTAQTVVDLLHGKYDGVIDGFQIIDCRFPYEYEGGHIMNAININTMEDLEEKFFKKTSWNSKVVYIFHCEFSSHRAPRLALYLRKEDRNRNLANYPNLYYPEVYILEGGYRAFFSSYKDKCVPQKYIEMNDSEYKHDCKKMMACFRKSWKRSRSFSDVPNVKELGKMSPIKWT